MMKSTVGYIRFGGFAAIVGCVFAVLLDILAIAIYEDHNPIRQTISQLAHGKYAYIQDIGLLFLGIGCIFGGIALYHLKSSKSSIKLGGLALLLMGLCIGVLAEFNDIVGKPGTTLHFLFATTIGILFLVFAICFGLGTRKVNEKWYHQSIFVSTIFLLGALAFLWIAPAYQGLYKRCLALVMFGWI